MTDTNHTGTGLERAHAQLSVVLIIAAVVSLLCLLYAGRHNGSNLLLILMSLWVLTPYEAINFMRTRWRKRGSPTGGFAMRVYMMMIVATVMIYFVDSIFPLSKQRAFAFVVTPALLWLTIIGATLRSKMRRPRPDTRASSDN